MQDAGESNGSLAFLYLAAKSSQKEGCPNRIALFSNTVKVFYFAALAALIASISSGVTLNRSPQMP